ncbi:MAG: PSD1 and planctomycete cytochrome C domain-containing protein [Pirellulales bacterium]
MNLRPLPLISFLILLLAWLTTPGIHAASQSKVDYNRDIRPLLANHCFACHGPDREERQADLRLDTATGALANREGQQAIVPGNPDTSRVLMRIAATDPTERMPPEESGPKLTSEQIALIRKWIEQGAPYQRHWSFQPVVRPKLPTQTQPLWSKHPIDRLVMRRLVAADIQPAAEASRTTLIRRLSLDLTGLPPTLEEIDQFVTDPSPQAYEQLVDRLLASKHFGERWARHWLDQARYADTHGYTIDSERSMWPYRDWVIDAINADMPFDQFTIEQLAGDLLPAATQEQLVATGFHRNTLINQEGGSDKEQFRNEAVVDRVNTTGAVWLGLTVGCAQCHHHKFDPISQKEYYQLFAFFNSDQDANSTAPIMRITTRTQQTHLDQLKAQIEETKDQISNGKQKANNLKQLQDEKKLFVERLPSTMVLRSLDQPRATHVLIRGSFLRPGQLVESDTPAALPLLKPTSEHATRLDLAQWLVRRDNPLTARVTVNRLWMHYFGRGLVEPENDFGTQGSLPTHPQLLDWLALELMDSQWSLKHVHRLIVTSATYRQSSQIRPELTTVDPRNALLARQTRLRVDAEIVRDLGLKASGLLENKIGGPSVRPPQADGVYDFTQRQATWKTSEGADRYRRGMYTLFMRSAPYPLLTTFDTPRFNVTCTRRARSNTPLQALTMANDPTMLEMARALADRLLLLPNLDDQDRLRYAVRLCLARQPEPVELDRLLQYVNQERATWTRSTANASQLIRSETNTNQAVGSATQTASSGNVQGDNGQRTQESDQHTPETVDIVEQATWTMLARVLLNLDEFITRE